MDLCDNRYQDYTMWDDYDYDYCDECREYGNDYRLDDDGEELVDNCADCVFNPWGEENNNE